MTDKKMAGANASPKNSSAANVNTQTHLLEIQKNASERLRIGVKEYRGKTYIDIRCWYVGEDGEYRPSNKGVSVRPEHGAELVQGLMLALRATGRG